MVGTNPNNIFSIAKQSFNALGYLHKLGMVHGDISNGKNVLYVEQDERVIIIDFENDYHFDFNKLSNKDIDNIKGDQRDIALLLWLIIDGDISQDIYEDMNERQDYSSFIELMQQHRDDNDDDEHQTIIDTIISVYNDKFIPTDKLL